MAAPTQPNTITGFPITFVADDSGWLLDPVDLSFIVYDISSPANRGTPVQVFPATLGEEHVVDLVADKVSTGQYKADYTPGVERGRMMIQWFCTHEAGDPERTWRTEWEVLDARIEELGPLYAMVADLRDDGITVAQLTDLRAQVLIRLASAQIEQFTGNVFVPVPRANTFNGNGAPLMLFDDPIIAIDQIEIDITPYAPADQTGVSRDVARIYNTHLSQPHPNPDDRRNPKIELFQPYDSPGMSISFGLERLVFPRGQQNCHVSGVFGFTDPDGSPMGRTPALITHATTMMVRREVERLADGGSPSTAWRVTSERTRDQSVTYASPGAIGDGRVGSPAVGAFTGDAEIDTILAMFMRAPALGAA